jgi:hypothetical protein
MLHTAGQQASAHARAARALTGATAGPTAGRDAAGVAAGLTSLKHITRIVSHISLLLLQE